MQTVTRVIATDVEPFPIYRVLADASNIPKWAPVFADALELVNPTQYQVTKNGETFALEVILHSSAHAVDYLRHMTGGRRGGAYIRVTPRPLGGSTVIMTVPLGPGAEEATVAETLDQELAELVRLASSSS